MTRPAHGTVVRRPRRQPAGPSQDQARVEVQAASLPATSHSSFCRFATHRHQPRSTAAWCGRCRGVRCRESPLSGHKLINDLFRPMPLGPGLRARVGFWPGPSRADCQASERRPDALSSDPRRRSRLRAEPAPAATTTSPPASPPATGSVPTSMTLPSPSDQQSIRVIIL